MKKLPEFPPRIEQWAPGDPFEGEPPLPRWMWNPARKWLPPDVRREMEEMYGYYATRRTEAMVPPRDGVELAKRVAGEMYRRWIAGYTPEVLPKVPRERRPRKPRKPREESVAPEDVRPLVGEWIATEYKATGRWPSVSDIIEETKREHKITVGRDWAEEVLSEAKELARGV